MSEKMTAADATTFERGRSNTSEMIVEAAARERGCTCAPYVDWFTLKRWNAQGYRVTKGEHGVTLTTYIPVKKINPKTGEKEPTGYTRPRNTRVFCRCQVHEVTK